MVQALMPASVAKPAEFISYDQLVKPVAPAAPPPTWNPLRKRSDS